MLLRRRVPREKITAAMAPMIDVVFLLLIFFMLTLKIVEPEGDFQIALPPAPVAAAATAELPPQQLNVRLEADTEGRLTGLRLGSRQLGNTPQAFDLLNTEVLRLIGRSGNPHTSDIEVTIDADYQLNHEFVVRAISACSGRLDEQSGQIVRYLDKIRLKTRQPPTAGS